MSLANGEGIYKKSPACLLLGTARQGTKNELQLFGFRA
jgi:hypothetical protein